VWYSRARSRARVSIASSAARRAPPGDSDGVFKDVESVVNWRERDNHLAHVVAVHQDRASCLYACIVHTEREVRHLGVWQIADADDRGARKQQLRIRTHGFTLDRPVAYSRDA
jgi:hypothetical protein